MELVKEVRNRVDLINARVLTACGLLAAGIFVKDFKGVRNRLPEPFDVMDHIGNVSPSLQLGVAAGGIVGLRAEHNADSRNEGLDISDTRIKMGAAGFTLALVINTLAETNFGLELLGSSTEYTTPDNIDLVYGVVAGTVGGGLLPTVAVEYPETV